VRRSSKPIPVPDGVNMILFKKILMISKIIFIFFYTILLSLTAGIGLLFKEGDKKYFFFARHWARFTLKVFGIKVNMLGLEKISNSEGLIYVANHASMFDIWVLQANLPGQLRFIGKKEINKIPIFGWIWKYSGNIPIDRKNPKAFLRSLQRAAETIKSGRCIIIYPEGTRTRDGRIQPFKRGTFSVAFTAKAKIIPVTINGSYSILKKGSIAINPGTIDVIIHEAIEPDYNNMSKNKQLEILNQVQDTVARAYIDQ
jgi:1-acyl-sn-glycerol-3-phosphate acyltransferase